MRQKSALFIAISEEISFVSEKTSATTALFHRWFLALKIFVFSAVHSWISAVQRFSGNEQRWNRPEIILNQSCSAMNVSETSTRDTIYFWKTAGMTCQFAAAKFLVEVSSKLPQSAYKVSSIWTFFVEILRRSGFSIEKFQKSNLNFSDKFGWLLACSHWLFQNKKALKTFTMFIFKNVWRDLNSDVRNAWLRVVQKTLPYRDCVAGIKSLL